METIDTQDKTMKVMLSACLLGENCKYDGGNNYDPDLVEFLRDKEVIPVCPEVMGGLPVPRIPSEIRNGVVVNREGTVVDHEFREGAQKTLATALGEQPELILLKSRSPSCGVKQHYDGTFSGTLTEGPGITAQLLIEHGFHVMDAEDLQSPGKTRHLAHSEYSAGKICNLPGTIPDSGI